ncbi:unnamed protein product [Trichobilharzia regenti]|nr:unnamed protein product [Trichobilharzia regenti]
MIKVHELNRLDRYLRRHHHHNHSHPLKHHIVLLILN